MKYGYFIVCEYVCAYGYQSLSVWCSPSHLSCKHLCQSPMYETKAYISSVDSVCILGHDNIPRSERLGLLFPHDIYSIRQGPVVCTCSFV